MLGGGGGASFRNGAFIREDTRGVDMREGLFVGALHTATAPVVRAAVKTYLSYRNDTKLAFFSQLTKIKTVGKLLWTLIVVNLRIPGLI